MLQKPQCLPPLPLSSCHSLSFPVLPCSAVPFLRCQPGPELSPGLKWPGLSVSSRAVAAASHLKEGDGVPGAPDSLGGTQASSAPVASWQLGSNRWGHLLRQKRADGSAKPAASGPWVPGSLSQGGRVACSRDGSRVAEAAQRVEPVPATPRGPTCTCSGCADRMSSPRRRAAPRS